MALTQEQVVKRAVDLMAEAGLEALTLRRLATELGCRHRPSTGMSATSASCST